MAARSSDPARTRDDVLNHYTGAPLTAQFIDPAVAGPLVDLSETVTPLTDFQVTVTRSQGPRPSGCHRSIAATSSRHQD